MSLTLWALTTKPKSFPRVSGDEPARIDRIDGRGEFSPRERG